jgi:hypothetical protein
VRPRTAPLNSRLDGVAAILGCHIVESVVKDFPVLPNSPAGSVQESSDASLSYSLSEDSESDSSSPRIPSLDVPFEAHILPGRGRRHRCAPLPFFCVADSENIEDLMTSVACQRYVWGITQPVVGFELSDRGVEASLIISWLDPSTVSLATSLDSWLTVLLQNVVHVSRTAPDGPGIFDFTDAASTLAFSQFIQNLESHFAIIPGSKFGLRPTNTFDWRADIINIPSEDFTGWRDRVARWVCDVGMCADELPTCDDMTAFVLGHPTMSLMKMYPRKTPSLLSLNF